MKNKLFIVGIVIFTFGAMAMDSVGAGGMIACVMVALGTVLAFAGYASEQLEKAVSYTHLTLPTNSRV